MFRPIRFLSTAASILTSIFSSADPAAKTTATTGPTTQPVDKKPAMFEEAKLPAGFPQPGPILEVVIKEYPAARVARVQAAGSKDGSANSMFWPLFNHIKKNHIEMSAPVDMTWNNPVVDGTPAKPQAMAFVYGDPAIGQTGTDGVVEVVDLPATTVASITIRGDYDREHFTRGINTLNEWLAGHDKQYKISGSPRYLGYNSPMVPPFMRLGEVQVPVTKISP